jgi:excinuclease UvrABC nuclease subunit
MENQEIIIPRICLEWSEWTPWRLLDLNINQGGARVPAKPGVYEVKRVHGEERLTIGKASNLRKRIKRGLVMGRLSHSTGARIREFEDPDQLLVRWAVTERPAAVEEELHRLYQERYGVLPEHTRSAR